MVNLVFLVIVCTGLGWFLYTTFWRDKRIRRRRFAPEWEDILQQNLPPYTAMSTGDQSRLQQLIQLFLAKKEFYGCAGLVLTDEIRITVAAQACMLLLNRGWTVYPKLQAILIYPDAFRAERDQLQGDGTVAATGHNLLGESWSNGRVILSWEDIIRGARDFTDGHNVVLHEFAHQLDSQSGSTNGAPPLYRNSYQSWANIFSENFDDLQLRSVQGKSSVMDQYGATNPAEFFAVATEAFFEKPRQLKERRPELYQELQTYYNLDPAQWQQDP